MALHGTFTHRVTCNLHPHQHEIVFRTAQSFSMRVGPFMRDAAIAYCQQRTMLPEALQKRLTGMVQEIRRVGTNLNQIAARANSYQRVSHQDLRNAGKLVQLLEHQVHMLRQVLESLPHDHQVHVA